jgi:hypothetical protein
MVAQVQNKVENKNRCKMWCVYAGGKPLIYVLLLNEPLAKVVIVAGCNIYAFAYKEEAREFLRQYLKEKLGIENFEIGPCPAL